MTDEELIRRHPRVWHMAAAETWPGIQERGLLSVSGLLDVYGYEGGARRAVESARRPECVTLKRDGLPDAVVRDNKPMFEKSLLKCLQDGLTPSQWYEILNAKAFFWADRKRLDRLLGAYSSKPQVVLEVDTAGLLERHRDRVRLSAINSGQTARKAQLRGLSTFRRIEDFPDGKGALGTKERPRVVELVVEDGVPDVMEIVQGAHRVEAGAWTAL